MAVSALHLGAHGTLGVHNKLNNAVGLEKENGN